MKKEDVNPPGNPLYANQKFIAYINQNSSAEISAAVAALELNAFF